MDIWLYRRCWCMTGVTPRSSRLRVIKECLRFIAGHDTMQKKKLSFFAVEVAVPVWQDVVRCSCFWIIPNSSKCFLNVVWSTRNDSASSVRTWPESSWSKATNSSSSNFFGEPSGLYLQHQNHYFEASKPISASCFRQRMVTVSLNKNSKCFSSRILLCKGVQ